MKYVMIPINIKIESKNKVFVRRVLISYLFKTIEKTPLEKKIVTYHGTKFIIADPYFTSNNLSHKYIFNNKYYCLTEVTNENKSLYNNRVFKPRKYHGVLDLGCESVYGPIPTVIEFKEKDITKAIEKFQNREELR